MKLIRQGRLKRMYSLDTSCHINALKNDHKLNIP